LLDLDLWHFANMLSYHVANGRCTFLFVFGANCWHVFLNGSKSWKNTLKKMQILHEKETPAQR
jgi:hypothetical protein